MYRVWFATFSISNLEHKIEPFHCQMTNWVVLSKSWGKSPIDPWFRNMTFCLALLQQIWKLCMVGVLNVLHETLNPSSLFSSCIKKNLININTSIFLPKKNVIFNSLFIRVSYFAIAELGEESCEVIMYELAERFV